MARGVPPPQASVASEFNRSRLKVLLVSGYNDFYYFYFCNILGSRERRR
jgi:hypothetical protein